MSFEVYADASIGGIRESDEPPDGMVFYATLDEARSVLRARLRQARRVQREQRVFADART